MTKKQRRESNLYRKECRFCGVEPVLADFFAGNIPSCVRFQMKLSKRLG